MSVSLLGDGIYLVALAWQVYELSDAPTALSLVGVAWTVPQLIFLLAGGVVSDRLDRRKVLVISDVIRGVSIAILGVLSVTGMLVLWHVVVLVAVYGIGEAFFGPAFGAIVPEVVAEDRLVEANALDQLVRPIAWRLLGPALGGLVIAAVGAGSAFLIDAVTFLISAACVLAMSPLPRPTTGAARSTARREVAEGFAFVRSRPWLWATILAAAVGQFAFYGPYQVLMPFVVKYRLGGGAGELGYVYAIGGIGAIAASLVVGQRGLPRHHITWVYIGWGVGSLGLVGFAVAQELWIVMATSFVMISLFTVGIIIWTTLMHQLVPSAVLGRVSSFDWLVSSAFIPLSYAAVGPVSHYLGARTTLIGAGFVGCASMLAFLAIPGVRSIERDQLATSAGSGGVR